MTRGTLTVTGDGCGPIAGLGLSASQQSFGHAFSDGYQTPGGVGGGRTTEKMSSRVLSSRIKKLHDFLEKYSIKPHPETLLIPVFLPTNNGIFRDLFKKSSIFSSKIPCIPKNKIKMAVFLNR